MKEKLKSKWCNWFHACLRLPNENWTKFICPKCGAEHELQVGDIILRDETQILKK